jgi:hypothetical protein
MAITNEINAFAAVFSTSGEVSFCVIITQRRAFSRSCWLPDEKIIGHAHFVHQLHLRGKRFRQTARRD